MKTPNTYLDLTLENHLVVRRLFVYNDEEPSTCRAGVWKRHIVPASKHLCEARLSEKHAVRTQWEKEHSQPRSPWQRQEQPADPAETSRTQLYLEGRV